tara:strand:+ start:7790 stop:8632 length:843 start_codon:yes stop_codon:yes gene_type:complete
VAVNTLISVQALHSALDQTPRPIIIDCRFSLLDAHVGEQEYRASHITGAQYAHLNQDLSGPVTPGQTGRHPLPDRSVLIKTIQKFGINNHQPVVAYDGGNGAYAARLWWLLRWLGHEEVFVLDGGFEAWQRAGFASTTEIPAVIKGEFNGSQSLVQIIEADAIVASQYTVTDARDPARFRGEVEPIDPIAGHIPGAKNLPFTDNMASTGTFKTSEALTTQFLEAKLSETNPTICYCGSGVTACHNILALIHSGFPEPILYPGSWSEWVTNPQRPIATGLD